VLVALKQARGQGHAARQRVNCRRGGASRG
jgi:hypothetical protein